LKKADIENLGGLATIHGAQAALSPSADNSHLQWKQKRLSQELLSIHESQKRLSRGLNMSQFGVLSMPEDNLRHSYDANPQPRESNHYLSREWA
jgi:hypothetical protein